MPSFALFKQHCLNDTLAHGVITCIVAICLSVAHPVRADAPVTLAQTSQAEQPAQETPDQPADEAAPAADNDNQGAAEPANADAPADDAPPEAEAPVTPAPIAAADIQAERDTINEWRGIVDTIETTLQRDIEDDAELAGLRSSLDPIRTGAPALIVTLQDRVRTIEARVNQLGEPPAEGAPAEAPTIQAEREALNSALAEVRGVLTQARLTQVQADQLDARIAERRRGLFTARLSERNRAPFEPSLWADVLPQLPRLYSRLTLLISEGSRATLSNMSPTATRTSAEINLRLGIIALSIIIGAGMILYGRRKLTEVYRRVPRDSEPSRLEKFAGAAWLTVVDGLVPILAIYIVLAAVSTSGFMPDRLLAFLKSAVTGIAFFLFLRAVAIATLAPRAPAWRLPAMPQDAAVRLTRIVMVVAALVGFDEFLNATLSLLVASLQVEVVRSGIFALSVAVCGIVAMRIIAAVRPLDQGDGDGDTMLGAATVNAVARPWGWLRAVVWLAFATIGLCALLGYVALAAYGATHLVLAIAIATLTVILLSFTEELSSTLVADQHESTRALARGFGVSRSAMEQLIVVTSGLFRLFLIIAAAVMLLLPWGLETRQWTGWIRSAFFGVEVGEITISFSTILSALAVFVAGLLATRAVKRWLDNKYLPRTKMDIGLKSSVSTALGYVGVVLAAAIAVSFVGFNLANLAIVAGALSLGIGFGLQSIVNNFVSGLILLAERPVKVGDWIQVAGEQGYVRRISVRATEVQTFDRATVIVPNSDLISGVVKNMMLSDRTGRIRIPVGVSYDSDAEQVRELLLDAAREHEGVLSFPAPAAYFLEFGASSLDFMLYAYLADVDNSLSVSSDLRYAILKRFREAGIEIPFPQSDIHVRGPVELSGGAKA